MIHQISSSFHIVYFHTFLILFSDLFHQRLGELQSKRSTESSSNKGIGRKVKNFGKAIKTKLLEAKDTS